MHLKQIILTLKTKFQGSLEGIDLWGSVTEIFQKDAQDQLPAEDDSKETIKIPRWMGQTLFLFSLGYCLGFCYADLLHCLHHPVAGVSGLQRDAHVRVSQGLPLADSALASCNFPLHPRLHCRHDPLHRPLRDQSSLPRIPHHCYR